MHKKFDEWLKENKAMLINLDDTEEILYMAFMAGYNKGQNHLIEVLYEHE